MAPNGVPRVHAELGRQGCRVGRKRVTRLIRHSGLAGVSRRRGTRTTHRERLQTGFVFLAIVLDVFSRKVVGWAMANHLRTELVLAALNMASAQRRPQGVIHHSDKGAQYTSLAFGKQCREAAVVTSTGVRSRPARKHAWPSSSTWNRGTTPGACTPRWGT